MPVNALCPQVALAANLSKSVVLLLLIYCFMYLPLFVWGPGLEVIKLEFILRLKIKRNNWLLADTCLQAANHCAFFRVGVCTKVK